MKQTVRDFVQYGPTPGANVIGVINFDPKAIGCKRIAYKTPSL
jgi:hypothetical protein